MKVFPERQLRDFAENVLHDRLVIGECYYLAEFLDSEMLIPELTPIHFLGKGVPTAEPSQLVFQDARTYLRQRNSEAGDDDSDVVLHVFDQSEGLPVYCFDEALNVLLRCSLRREKKHQHLPSPNEVST